MKGLVIILLALLMVVISHAQNVKKGPLVAPVTSKVEKDLPSVYITFENYGKSLPKRNENGIDVAWLRLHNNLRATIGFCIYDTSISNTGKPGIYYEIERIPDYTDKTSLEKPTLLAFFPSVDFCTEYKLKSRASYLFGVPYDRIPKDSRVKIAFTFPWESERDVLLGKEAAHFVSFYGTDLLTSPR